MLGEIRHRFEKALRTERGVPVRVEYGPIEPARLGEMKGDVFVLQRADGDASGLGGSRGRGRRFDRALACELHVYATSTKAGARRQEHEDRADELVAQALLALDDVLRGGELDGAGVPIPGTHCQWEQGRGGFVRDPAQAAAGAHYLQLFTIRQTVRNVPFDGVTGGEFVMGEGSIRSTTTVKGSTGEGAGETSCGGD